MEASGNFVVLYGQIKIMVSKINTLLIPNIKHLNNIKYNLMMILTYVRYLVGILDQYYLICWVVCIFWIHKKLSTSSKIKNLLSKQLEVINHFLHSYKNFWVKCFIIILKKEWNSKPYFKTHIFQKLSVNISKRTNQYYNSQKCQCKKPCSFKKC